MNSSSPAIVTVTMALAPRINAEHRLATAAARTAIEHAHEAGRLLIEAKAQCDHGTWHAWLEVIFEGSARTARAYMLVAERWPTIEAYRRAHLVAEINSAVEAMFEEARDRAEDAKVPKTLRKQLRRAMKDEPEPWDV